MIQVYPLQNGDTVVAYAADQCVRVVQHPTNGNRLTATYRGFNAGEPVHLVWDLKGVTTEQEVPVEKFPSLQEILAALE